MSPASPEGSAWPEDGSLEAALAERDSCRPLSLYVHVPFCSVRCGYCDFNTYTTGFGPGAAPGDYAPSILAEARLATRILADAGWAPRAASTVFLGGGTPTLLASSELARILDHLRSTFGIAEDAEVTVEANPDSIDAQGLEELRAAGVTRVSFGMQSAVPSVLATLDRTHDPERVPIVVEAAKDTGLDVSLDLIYGAPGESLEDWRRSVEVAIGLSPDHISAYALVIEEGTKMGRMLSRGAIPEPDSDEEAAKYELADAMLAQAGYRWYEISNFARAQRGEDDMVASELRYASKHNLAYWRDCDWWGLGPGAHSHVGRYRWWNLKHPRAYASRVSAGMSPAAAGEILDADSRSLEKVMLAVRTAEGLAIADVPNPQAIDDLSAEGLIEKKAVLDSRIVLTLRGRLLADAVTRRLMGF
ncbi:coproporphyrinogen dehydrogenase [Schaalia cardiffensis F0333]|uniref:Heme chaperone HemW n=1 Tax=Schaalia cardiffensis F0333 TaxID=888050 RepID=N6X2X9_9ACTO|nr:radical SAM family heme chaperone HemW [Schaalia cardiffensis]ENO17782.1 coproporphyrinogen dehydrogenase [Schaalia cardiffensis F0333]